MQVSSCFILFLIFIGIDSRTVKSAECSHLIEHEPRLFFRQMAEASGLFPLELNVPDMISYMASGMSSMFSTMSSYFGSGSEEGGGDEGGAAASYDQVDDNSVQAKHRNKKLNKKLKKKKTSAEDYDGDDDDVVFFDWFEFLF